VNLFFENYSSYYYQKSSKFVHDSWSRQLAIIIFFWGGGAEGGDGHSVHELQWRHWNQEKPRRNVVMCGYLNVNKYVEIIWKKAVLTAKLVLASQIV